MISREASPHHTYAQILKNEVRDDENDDDDVDEESVPTATTDLHAAANDEFVGRIGCREEEEEEEEVVPRTSVADTALVIQRPVITSEPQPNEDLTEKLQRRSNFSTEFIPSLARTPIIPVPKHALPRAENSEIPTSPTPTPEPPTVPESTPTKKKHVSSFNIKIGPSSPRKTQVTRASSTPAEATTRSNTMTLTSMDTAQPDDVKETDASLPDVETVVSAAEMARLIQAHYPPEMAITTTAAAESNATHLATTTTTHKTDEMPSMNAFASPQPIKSNHGMSDEEKIRAQEDHSISARVDLDATAASSRESDVNEAPAADSSDEVIRDLTRGHRDQAERADGVGRF